MTMNDELLTSEEQAFFARLAEMPERRAGGAILSIGPLKRGESEFRSRKARYETMSPTKPADLAAFEAETAVKAAQIATHAASIPRRPKRRRPPNAPEPSSPTSSRSCRGSRLGGTPGPS